MLEHLLDAMDRAVEDIERRADRDVEVLHHNDADGLSSVRCTGCVSKNPTPPCSNEFSRIGID